MDSTADAAQNLPEATAVSSQIGAVVYVAGHVALRMIVYMEGLQSALKRKRLADEDARAAEQKEKNKEKQQQQQQKKKKGGKGAGKAAEEENEEDAATSMG